ncbi:glycosyltransferase family 2 protein [Enterococcus sp. LJL98]
MKVALVIPTYNAGEEFRDVLALINQQREILSTIKIIDSSSIDNTVELAKEFNCEVEMIKQSDFSHGGTRRRIGIEFYEKEYDYLIFMTQDVYLQEDALQELLKFIQSDSMLGLAYGKQEVDLSKGDLFEYYARKFNYPDKSYKRKIEDVKKYGIKTIFSSDAFVVYNLALLNKVDFFEDSKDVSEDMLVAHKMVQSGYSVGYCSEARVYHTHNYNMVDEYKRYKEIGKFYKKQAHVLEKYGKTTSNGLSLALGELSFLIKKRKVFLLPKSVLRNAAKFIGHKVGYYYGNN